MRTIITIILFIILALCGCIESVELNASNIDAYQNHYVTCNITLTDSIGSYDRQETETRSTLAPAIDSEGHVTIQTVYYTVPVTRTYQMFNSKEGVRVAIRKEYMEKIPTNSNTRVFGTVSKIDEYPGSTLIIK